VTRTPDPDVEAAKGGDRDALERLVGGITDDVYGLAVRMLWHPADAEDATQEILVRVVNHLSAFRGEAAFNTWVYRIATNHLLTTRQRRAERAAVSFDAFAADLAEGLDIPYDSGGVDDGLLAEEVKIGCTQGMLLCLDRDHRAAYVLGEVFELPSDQAGSILEIAPAAYRKRLSRARERIRSFMEGNCGLVDPANPCRCTRRIGQGIRVGHVTPDRLLFANAPTRPDHAVRAGVGEMKQLHATAVIFRSHPDYQASQTVATKIKELLDSNRYAILAPDAFPP
jgi:RNA polymerase sigma factor (sigma-70 family)